MALTTAFAAVGGPATAGAATPNFTLMWSRDLPDIGHPIGLSSPNVATLGGAPAVVVGDRAGYVYALSLSSGQAVPGWPASTGGVPVDSTPSVVALGGSADDTVFVGLGNSSTPHEGGYEALNANGTVRWSVAVKNPSTDHSAGTTSAVMASLAVGELQGGLPDVVAPSVGQEEYAINASTGATLPGFPWFSADSGFATPALADLYANGQTDIVEGGDQTAGLAYGVQYSQGGHLRVLTPTGTSGTESPTGGLDCEYNPDQGVQSSPAVGQFLAGSQVGIVVGTSHAFAGASASDKVLAFNTHCQVAWQATLNGATESSPALADIEGNGHLDVVEGTDGGPRQGSVYALDGATGAVLWSQAVGEVIGGVVTVDLGQGYQDVVVPTTDGAEILDGRDGQVVTTLAHSLGLQSAPLVTEDPNGTIGITVAGYNGHNQGQVDHFELAGSSGRDVSSPGAWPVFHHDPQLTGNAGVPAALVTAAEAGGTAARGHQAASCTAPAGGPNGYYEAGMDGSVFRFGNLAVCGSLVGHQLPEPIVGLASTPDGGGYWLVGRGGHVYAFGDAKSYALTGPAPAPATVIVAIAPTPDGAGYWLLSQHGEVYSYGDARSYGPQRPLSGPMTAMAPTTDGRGYWLVAADGQVHAFGDAHLASGPPPLAPVVGPIVGIAADSGTGGYWLVSSEGLIYSFNATVFGSVPSATSEHGIAGIQGGLNGAGYRLVDTGGGLFCFGTSTQLGSANASHPQRPIIAISAP